jgi:hypothetical protein
MSSISDNGRHDLFAAPYQIGRVLGVDEAKDVHGFTTTILKLFQENVNNKSMMAI